MLISTDFDALRVFADPLRSRIAWLLSREQPCTTHLAEKTGARLREWTDAARAAEQTHRPF